MKRAIRYIFEKIISTVKRRLRYLASNSASPLVEEGLLIGLAIIIFLVIATILTDVVDWVNQLANNLPS